MEDYGGLGRTCIEGMSGGIEGCIAGVVRNIVDATVLEKVARIRL